jgi:hypothetical protein
MLTMPLEIITFTWLPEMSGADNVNPEGDAVTVVEEIASPA